MSSQSRKTARLALSELERRETPSSVNQNFDSTALGVLPSGWAQWSSGSNAFSTSDSKAFSPSKSLASSAASNVNARVWPTVIMPANTQVSATLLADSLTPTEVFARGQSLGGSAPSFYAANVIRGTRIQIIKSAGGARTVLGSVQSTAYTSNVWLRVTLKTNGSQIEAQLQNIATTQYLNSNGQWQSEQTSAIAVTDTTLLGNGVVGINRPAQYAGPVFIDDFKSGITKVVSNAVDVVSPEISITSPAPGVVSGTINVTTSTAIQIPLSKVEFRVDGQLMSTDTQAPYAWSFNTNTVANGLHTISVRAYDVGGNTAEDSVAITVANGTVTTLPPLGGPAFPRHYQHIRIAQLAYSGTPMTSFELGLLQNSVDLVVPNPIYLSTIQSVAPDTPQLIYTNLSNLYEGLLLDWNNYADARSMNRENAFYHVAQATSFTGSSPSSIPVSWLWRVALNSTDFTSASRTGTVGDVSLGSAVGDVASIGFPEEFRELNFAITTPAGASWSGVWEYPTAVNAAGQPTAWAALPIISDTTNDLANSGRISFDPPANWQASTANGPDRLYFVRLRTTSAGTSPVAATILGRDYTGANGGNSGTMPAFDAAADQNNDAYLNDAEYANRAAGKDARFRYESRLFYPAYGQMRFAVNPAPQATKDWAADFMTRAMNGQPLADGAFVDNSNGRSPANGVNVLESTTDYSNQFGLMLGAANSAIAPRWLMANTTGYDSTINNIVTRVPATMEEFSLRPLATTWSRFYDYAGMAAARIYSPNGPYLILDSHPQNGSPTDPRMQLATLAYYYLLADPERTFLMLYGGYEPNTSWTRHWVPAINYDVGAPQGTWAEFAVGTDPANTALTYKIFARNYANALVLYKPQSYTSTAGTGGLGDNTATTHDLGGTFRPLQADGTLGAPVTSISLRNGEGAILTRT